MNCNSINPCGIRCDNCRFFKNLCGGCRSKNGNVFWAKEHTEKGVCPIFDCSVNKLSYNDCGHCFKLPCNIFFDLKDPEMSEEDHKNSIIERVKALKN